VKGSGTLDARNASWLDASGTVITDTTVVQETNEPGAGEVILVHPLLSAEDLCSQGAMVRTGGRAVALSPQRLEAAIGARDGVEVPDRWSVELAGRNPSSAAVAVALAVPNPTSVSVVVYDVAGRRVRGLQDGALDPGYYTLTWDRSRDGGGRVATGVYFVRVESPEFRATRKVVLLTAGQ
jgi:hypothetical protein